MKEFRKCWITLGLIILLGLSTIPISESEQSTLSSYITTLQSPTPNQDGNFGIDIALSGDRLVVGEIRSQIDDISEVGKAYLYDTDWELIATLTPNTPKTRARFGLSVDIKGDILLVSSLDADVGDILQAGEVQVYDSSGTLLYTLQSNQPKIKERFGRRLAIGNGIILMGYADVYSDRGTVPVFDMEQNYLTTLQSQSMDESLAGEALDANDEFFFIGGSTLMGSVFVFDYNLGLLTTLQSPDGKKFTRYGECIAVSEDHLVVGEPGANLDENNGAGKAYVYDTDWNLLTTLQSPAPEDDAEFGVDVSIAGDLVVVGEAKGDVTSGDEGKVYVFDLSGNLLDTIVSPEPETGAEFGCNVVTDGELLVVSEVYTAVGGLTGAGKIHVFRLGEYEQAVFDISNLIINPESVKVGESVTISVDVENLGTISGMYPLKLMINGNMVEEKSVTVDESLSEKVIFTYQTETEGSYIVEIGDLSDSFEVKKPVIPGFPVMALVFGLSLLMIFVTQRKR